MTTHRLHAIGFLAAAAMAGSAAMAAPPPFRAVSALRHCGPDTCLVVSGRRADPAAPIRVAGHEVAVQGGRNWRAIVPLADVRAWSAPGARSIAVAVTGPGGGTVEATLPIGLLGHVTELASLDVGVRR